MKALIVGIFKLIYKVLSFFNLQPTLFVSLIGVILYLTGTFKANPTVLFIFQIALIITLIYAVNRQQDWLENRRAFTRKFLQRFNVFKKTEQEKQGYANN